MDNADFHDEIVKLASELYETSGRVEGRDLDNWLEAERIVKARHATERENEEEVIKSSFKEYTGNERRKHKRLMVKGNQKIIPHFLNTKIINISVGGIAIETTTRLEINKEYGLKINQRGNAFRLKGRVVWALLMRAEKKESGDIVPVYKAGMEFQQPLLGISVR
jgi:hypothetical protein